MQATETFGFTFDGEAGESFQTAVDKFSGWVVRITKEDGVEFDAMLVGADRDGEFYNDVIIRYVREDTSAPMGGPFTVTVRNIHIY